MPFALADPNSGEDLASRSIAIGVPSTFEENLSSAWQASRLNDRFIGEDSALSDEYDRYIDQTFKATGQRFPNPIRGELPPGVAKEDWTGDPRIPLPQDQAIRLFEEHAAKVGAHPPSADEFRKQAHARMFGLEQTRGDVAARASGWTAKAGQFLGTAAAITTDPPLLASMLFGGGEAATVLGAMGREALIAGGTETLVQPQIQTARLRAGLPGGFEQGAQNVLMAAGGAAALTGVFRGAASAYRSLRGVAHEAELTSANIDSVRYAERYSDLQSANPLSEDAAGAAEHVERVTAAQRRLYDSEASPDARMRDEPQAPLRRDLGRQSPEVLTPSDLPAAKAAQSFGQQLADQARAGADAINDFRASRAMARDLNGLGDAQIDLVRGPAPRAPTDDRSLVQFVINRGGLNDADRSLASIGVTSRSRPGLIRSGGLSASQMSELAAEAGYFPPALPGEGSRAVDQRELATAIRDELEGQPLYARHGDTGNVDARADFEARARLREDLLRAFRDIGVDPRKMSNQEIREAVQSLATAPDPVPEFRADHTAEAIDQAKRSAADLDYQAEREERLAMAAENNARESFAGRMNDLVYVEINGEVEAVRAADLFRSLDDDERLVSEWAKCINEVPF